MGGGGYWKQGCLYVMAFGTFGAGGRGRRERSSRQPPPRETTGSGEAAVIHNMLASVKAMRLASGLQNGARVTGTGSIEDGRVDAKA